MAQLRLVSAFAILFLAAACGSDDAAVPDASADATADAAAPPDAPSPDAPAPAQLDCLGDPSPTIANDPVLLMGSAVSISLAGPAPVAGAMIEALLESDPGGDNVASGVSDANGAAELSLTTGGVPADVFVRTTPIDTFLTTELFFPDVVAADTPAPGVLFEAGTINLLASVAGANQDFVNNGFALVIVLDCAGNPIFNATVTVPSGTIVYAGDNGAPDASLTSTSTAGTAFVFDVTPGEPLVFDAEVDGMSLRDNTARAVAGQVSSIGIRP